MPSHEQLEWLSTKDEGAYVDEGVEKEKLIYSWWECKPVLPLW